MTGMVGGCGGGGGCGAGCGNGDGGGGGNLLSRPNSWMGRSSFRSLCLSALLVNSNTLAPWPSGAVDCGVSSGATTGKGEGEDNGSTICRKVACNKSAGWNGCCNRRERYRDPRPRRLPAFILYLPTCFLLSSNALSHLRPSHAPCPAVPFHAPVVSSSIRSTKLKKQVERRLQCARGINIYLFLLLTQVLFFLFFCDSAIVRSLF